jgi:hypothetical protein
MKLITFLFVVSYSAVDVRYLVQILQLLNDKTVYLISDTRSILYLLRTEPVNISFKALRRS